MVVFSGIEFLFRFLPIFLAVYYITPPRYRNTTLLFGSIVFYAAGEPYYVLLLMFSVWMNYILAKRICFYETGHKWKKRKRKDWLITALLIDAGLLAVFKILSIFWGNAVMPLGLSFFTFKMISFQADIYRKEIKEMPTFKRTAVYFTMFPQIISGPVMRYNDGAFTLEKRNYSLEKLEEGFWYFAIGLGTKVLLADKLAILWKNIATIGYESISTPLAWLGAFSYSMQLYFDFWGYSMMASGLCVMLGFPFIMNFDHPYAARSISEFWRRWHMTLGSWFRDYVYIPLGGSRAGTLRTVRNLLIVWLLTGIWHGSGLNFLLWGMALFLLIVLEKLLFGRWLLKCPAAGRIYVICLMPVTWMLFALTDLGQLSVYLGRMFPFIGGAGVAVNPQDIIKYAGMFGIYLLAGIIWCIPAVYRFLVRHRKHPAVVILTAVIFWLSVYGSVSVGNNPFMYLKF